MDPFGYHTKLIELAYGSVRFTATLRRRSMASWSNLGQGPFGPMASGMPGMQMPDAGKLMDETDKGLEGL